jgi:hypothetical protein
LGCRCAKQAVEDVRAALEIISAGLAPWQIVLPVKSQLSYGHRLGYLRFNAGAVIKVHGDTRSIAQRIVSEVEMGLLVRAARGARDRALCRLPTRLVHFRARHLDLGSGHPPR